MLTNAQTQQARQARSANLAFYEGRSQEFAAKAATYSLNAQYVMFLERLAPGSQILDAGCGSGRDAAAFMARGFAVKAIDISPAMVNLARSLGVDASVLAFQDMAFESMFDGIWACASFLHIPKHELPDALSRFLRALRPGGVCFFSLKEGAGESIAEDGRYFVYYQLDEFAQQLVTAGWKVVDARKVEANDPKPWLNYLAIKSED